MYNSSRSPVPVPQPYSGTNPFLTGPSYASPLNRQLSSSPVAIQSRAAGGSPGTPQAWPRPLPTVVVDQAHVNGNCGSNGKTKSGGPMSNENEASVGKSKNGWDGPALNGANPAGSYTVTASVAQSQFEIWNNKKYTTYKVAIKVFPPSTQGWGTGTSPWLSPNVTRANKALTPFAPTQRDRNQLQSQTWSVPRRYAEFSRLYDALKKSFPDIHMKLPGKRVLRNNFDPAFIEHRRQGLDNFIQLVVQEERLLHHEHTLEFLQLAHRVVAEVGSVVSASTASLSSGATWPRHQHRPQTASAPQPQSYNVYSQMKPLLANGQPIDPDDNINLGSSERKLVTPRDFDFLKVIGKGSFGKVLLARHKEEDKIFAVKVLQKQQIRKNNEVRHIMSERNILLKNVKHPFLVGLHYSFQTPDKLYFVLDYVNGGELFHHLQRERYFSEPRARFYSAEIASALGYLHSIGIIYRDLKPENLLLDSEGHIRLTDFGLCKEGITLENATTTTFCGTPEYLAPEILRKQPYTNIVDWWCLGAVLYEMLYGLPPFYSRDTAEMYDSILHKPLRLRTNVSEVVRDLLEQLLQKDPRNRLGYEGDFEDIARHGFFRPVDWNLLLQKKISPPYNPNVTSNYDLRHIDPEFTLEPVPASVGGLSSSALEHRAALPNASMDRDNAFAGFTYVPPIEGL